jgi:hypothetical protein
VSYHLVDWLVKGQRELKNSKYGVAVFAAVNFMRFDSLTFMFVVTNIFAGSVIDLHRHPVMPFSLMVWLYF